MAAEYDDGFSELVEFMEFMEEMNNDQAPCRARPALRVLRDRQNPMELFDDAEFPARYRFSKPAVLELLSLLPLHRYPDGRGCPVPPLQRLLIALRFYGAGTFQVVTGDLVNVSQPTVSRVVLTVSAVIAATLFPALVKFPKAGEMQRLMHAFYGIAQFPGVTGCIDCTHVRIKSPGGERAEVFRNRKGYFSYNVQAITGPRLEFLNVVASWPGSTHDSRIFDNSHARYLYEKGTIPGVLLGDMGYACRPYLMTPLRESGQRGSPEYRYNKAQIKKRNTVERAFGIWKRRFPCLDMKLQINTTTAAVVISACAALHNFGRLRGTEEMPLALFDTNTTNFQEPQLQQQPQPMPADSQCGSRARGSIIRHHFTQSSAD